jgi:hypothetical protein
VLPGVGVGDGVGLGTGVGCVVQAAARNRGAMPMSERAKRFIVIYARNLRR